MQGSLLQIDKTINITGQNNGDLNINGFDDPTSLAFLLSHSQIAQDKANVVIVSSEAEAIEFDKALKFFNKNCKTFLLPHFSGQMYSEIIPSGALIYKRMNWIYNAQQNTQFQDVFFIASLPSLLQKTLPYEVFLDNCFELNLNQELPTNISQSLTRMGYTQVPLVEDPGSFAIRGGIIDIFSPASSNPVRIELFGDIIDSIKAFSPKNQRSLNEVEQFVVIPAKEAIFSDENRQNIARLIKTSAQERGIAPIEVKDFLQDISHWKYFHGSDYFINAFYDNLESPLSYFDGEVNLWSFNKQSQIHQYDKFLADLQEHFKYSKESSPLLPNHELFFATLPQFQEEIVNKRVIETALVQINEDIIDKQDEQSVLFSCSHINEFKRNCSELQKDQPGKFREYLATKFSQWQTSNNNIIVTANSQSLIHQFQVILDDIDFNYEELDEFSIPPSENNLDAQKKIIITKTNIPQSIHFKDEKIVLLNLADLLGKKKATRSSKQKTSFKKAKALHFADLKPGDHIVHKDHGVGIYKGLTLMPIAGVDAEFLQLEYKGSDKLYLPIYRIGQIQKFTGGGPGRLIDKLGGQSWQKAKTKVKSKLKDIASELLKLYASRAQVTRPGFLPPSDNFNKFVNFFPYTETDDQLNAINHVINDMTLEKPMDRLICGDVGFGKTEVAMRAAFNAVNSGKQVALIAPTTILTFQHFENFKKRFQQWETSICCLNRFVSAAKSKEHLADIKSGKANIVIGTHRLFSKDVEFNDLGLLIIDEEQKFGVKHKEKIRAIKTNVDTLTLSATPIPRTLNMSFLGLRDLSLINTAPVDRLPTRTFICKYEQHTIKKSIQNEVDRGGQVFFLHNQVNNIETIVHELRELLPDVKFAVGHGQMNETALEKVMVKFFNKEVDVLVSTTIIESGMDIPNANTIIINNAQNLGLSQLYQLRGRVGRSSKRAYCYLMVPQNKLMDKVALERLKVIQENSSLGSGITIAQYDLELRGAGDLLGENQSGHVNTVGYELYMELLENAIQEQKGEPLKNNALEPEINLRIPALIPDKYISDIRLRLSYYKSLSDIESLEEMDAIEDDLRDQFGKLPDEVLNLMGIMLIRFLCKKLFIKDLSQAKSGITLIFTPDTPISTEQVLKLTARADKKYSLTPESKLLIKMKDRSWNRVFEEMIYLAKLVNVI